MTIRKPLNRTDRWLLSLFIFCGLLFGLLAYFSATGITQNYDELLLQTIYAAANPDLDLWAQRLTNLADVMSVIIIAVTIMAALFMAGKKQLAVITGLIIGGANLLNYMIKLIFARTRPDLWEPIILETSYSFPSGHSAASATLASVLVVLAWRTKYRWVVVATGLIFMVLIGLTRTYLGVHYPTDVMAGWSLGIGWSVLIVLIFRLYKPAPAAPLRS